MKDYKKKIQKHYGQDHLGTNIIKAFEHAGRTINSYKDTASFDDFHIGGREATRELGRLALLKKGMRVLDIGCGVGGPARTLAVEFACFIVGIDIVEEYCRTATMLTQRVGLNDMVVFQRGDMMDLPFAEGSFDVVWSEHTIMNIRDKAILFNEIHRVLKPKGTFALYEICSGSSRPLHFPVPWASDSKINFLIEANELRDVLMITGFEEIEWRDVTSTSLEWFRKVFSYIDSRPKNAPPLLGLNLLLGEISAIMARNVLRNLEENRIKVLQCVFSAKIIGPAEPC